MILLVVWPLWPLVVVWYTHVLPTATGNGIELAFTNDCEAAFWRVPVTELALCRALAPGPELEAGEVAPVDVLCPVSPGTSGAVAVPTPVHPARAMMAAPAQCAPLSQKPAKGMPRRVEADPHVVLGLEVRERHRVTPW